MRAVRGSPAWGWPLLLCHPDPGCCVAWMGRPLWIGSPGGLSPQRLPPPAACRLRSHCLTFTPASEEGGGTTGFPAPLRVWGLPEGSAPRSSSDFPGNRAQRGVRSSSHTGAQDVSPGACPGFSVENSVPSFQTCLHQTLVPAQGEVPSTGGAPLGPHRSPMTGVSLFLGSSRPDTELGSQGSRSWSWGLNIPSALTLRGVSEPRDARGLRSVSLCEASAGTEGKRLQANHREDI